MLGIEFNQPDFQTLHLHAAPSFLSSLSSTDSSRCRDTPLGLDCRSFQRCIVELDTPILRVSASLVIVPDFSLLVSLVSSVSLMLSFRV